MGLKLILTLSVRSIRCFSKKQPPEMKYLNVAEKNDAAKNISGLLSRGASTRREGFSPYNKIYEFQAMVFGQQSQMVMTSVSGHLLNYEFVAAFKGWQTCSPVALFDAPIFKNCPEESQRIKRTLEREIRSCAGLIIWTDCDREGENIGFEVIKVCTDIKPNIPVYRATFSEITTPSVFRALNNLGRPNKNISDAVDVRQEIDLRTGAAFTRLQTLRFQKVFPAKLSDKLISYGSCQFPTLGFVVERYQAIEEFVSEPFWRIRMSHQIKDLNVDFNWKRDRLFDKRACQAILDICLECNIAKVESVESKPKSKWRPLPLDTVELEKTVSRKLRINAKDTMKIAEKLYTQGLISYPRTETNIFPKELNLRPLVEQQCTDGRWGPFAQRILDDNGPQPRQGRKTDQAHPPIHPIKHTNDLNGNEKTVYEYIVRHFLACVSKDALGHETTVHVDIANEKFTAKGLMILERNYLDVYIYEKWTAKEIHCYRAGDTFIPTNLSLAEGGTVAPQLLTEADLIALMDKHGIGTDATHAEHIDKIKSREYVGLHENIYFVPGILGMGLVEGYNNIGLEVSLAKPALRSEFENDLKLISEGRKEPQAVLREQIHKYKTVFQTVLDKMAELDRTLGVRLNDRPQAIADDVVPRDDFKPVLKCPKCGSPMLLRTRKNAVGKFLSCSGYPACRNAAWLPNCVDTVDVLDEHCRNCGPDVKQLRVRFKQNPFPGEANPMTLCIGGCDENVLETFAINASSVRRVEGAANRGQQENPNRPVIANGNTLNNWVNSNGPIRPNGATNYSQNGHTTNQSQNRNATNQSQNRNAANQSQNRNATNQPQNRNATNPTQNRSTTNPTQNRSTTNNSQTTRATAANANNAQPSRSFLSSNSTTLMAVPSTSRNQPTATSNNARFNPQNATTTNNGQNNPNNSSVNNWANSSVWDSSFNAMEDPTEIRCNCGVEAVQLTVRKQGPNTGKQFYKCRNGVEGGGCDFFMWATNENATNRNHGTAVAPSNGAANVKCNCNVAAVERTVNKEGANKGRRFYCCAKPREQGCNFFQWADDVPDPGRGGGGGGGDDGGDDGHGGGGGGPSWGGANWQSNGNRWGSNWKKKTGAKGKRKKKTNAPYKASQKTKRKCGLCGEEGHIRTRCPNASHE